MRRALLVLAAALALSACASMLDSAYEDDQRRQCERDNRGVERAMC
ncbi:MAG TPA: hypothetical protein PLN53_01790 [Terricaulis sp.]|nr:hypothetical protein [Terricaulis sp.]